MSTEPAGFAVEIKFDGYPINPVRVIPGAAFFFGPFDTADEAQAWADRSPRRGTIVELTAEEVAARQIDLAESDYRLPLAAPQLTEAGIDALREICIQAMAAAAAPPHIGPVLVRNCLRRAYGTNPDVETTEAAFALVSAGHHTD